ncbi:MAG TPA: nucleotidyltransferase family protein [Solirubrobacterales bacterium]|nr:nucleotidyltransferase family protein [Solirubrobacterales bacterium]
MSERLRPRLGNQPTAEQLLVLHAALDEPASALVAWRRWRESVALDDADHGSTRLLPLVYRNLGPDAFDAEAAGRLKSLYRRSWRDNQLLFKRGAEAIGRLEGAGIETLVTKGASLALLSYGDVGARPMDDVDVLVPLTHSRDAIEVLIAAGWRAGHEDPLAWTAVHHSLGFAGPHGGHLDLHWFALWQPACDRELWRASAPLELAGTITRAPCPADQLLLACVHGAPWSPLPPFRWIADALATIRGAGEELEWERLASEAERRRLSVAAGAALAYLREEFGAPVPSRLLERLDGVRASRHERAAFRAAGQPDGPIRTLRLAWDRYRRLRDLDTGAPRPASFLSFARRFWGLESAWQLPVHAGRTLIRRRERDAVRSAP